jgi:hypothetical protein
MEGYIVIIIIIIIVVVVVMIGTATHKESWSP